MGGVAGIGAGHLKADAYVKTFQNPFGQFLSQTVDPINAASKAGSLTYDQAKAALDSFNQRWTAFDTASQQFSAMGGDYAKVVKQAYDPKKDFMKTVTGVRSTLENYVNQLKPADTGTTNAATQDATTPPDPNKPPGTGGQTAVEAARTAAVNQKRRNMAAPGFMSTILGGSMNNTTTQRKTLLGY